MSINEVYIIMFYTNNLYLTFIINPHCDISQSNSLFNQGIISFIFISILLYIYFNQCLIPFCYYKIKRSLFMEEIICFQYGFEGVNSESGTFASLFFLYNCSCIRFKSFSALKCIYISIATRINHLLEQVNQKDILFLFLMSFSCNHHNSIFLQ